MIRKPSTEQLLKALRGDLKGDPGYTPVKGKDYFTAQEIQEIISFIQSNVKDGYTPIKGVDYNDGYTPIKGKDYTDGKKGDAGDTPLLGVDYWTKEDKKKIEEYVLAMIEKKTPTTAQIISKLPKAPKVKYSDIEGAPDVSDLPKLIEFLKRGGFRGGGGSGGGTTSPLTTKGDLYTFDTANARLPVGSDGRVLSADSTQGTGLKWIALAGGGDMILAASQVVSGLKTFLDTTFGLRNVANTFTSFFTNTNTASRTYTLPDKNGTVAMTSDITGTNSGTNTGDQTITLTGGVTGSGTGSFAATVVTNANLTGDTTSVGNATTTVKLNGTLLSGLGTGLLKNTTGTGVPSIAINSDLPVMTATVGGAVPTPPNNTTTFLRGDGTFAAPAGSGDMVLANSQTNSGLKTFLDATFGLRNVANTFTSLFTNTNTAARTYTLPDASGTVALTSTTAPSTRAINTTAPLSGGGDLSADRTLTTSMATNKLIGRGTAGTGVMEEITLGTNLSLTGTTLNATGGGGVAWGAITGTLSSQTDLQNALNAKAAKSFAIAMAAAL